MELRYVSEKDDWTTDGENITSADNLAKIRKVLADEAPIIVEHWFYRASSSPEQYAFDEFEDFMDHLTKNARAGDIVNVWNFGQTCKNDNMLASGKCPDDEGRIPRRGAY